MSEAVVISLISGQAIVLAAVLPVLLSTRKHAKRAAGDAAEARDQVSNDHEKNLRVEGDERHTEVMRLLRSHGRTLGKHGRQMQRIEKRVGIVEDTIPTRKTTNRRKP